MKDYEALLKAPFSLSDLEWRVGSTFKDGQEGLLLFYVNARAIMDRLDDVFGIDGWKSDYEVYENGVICTLTATTEDGKLIQKSNGAEFTQMSGFKGGISGALKRAASDLGIGRYLYDMPNVNVKLENRRFKGKVLALPDEFMPAEDRTGCTEVKIQYRNSRNHGGSKASTHIEVSEDDLKAAMDFVVRGDKFNSGKKMSEVWDKSLRFLANSRDEEQARAARIVAQHKGIDV